MKIVRDEVQDILHRLPVYQAALQAKAASMTEYAAWMNQLRGFGTRRITLRLRESQRALIPGSRLQAGITVDVVV